MAKLEYSAPLLKFCPILLATGGGCVYPTTQDDYQCAVVDSELGEVLFMDRKNYGCKRIPASIEEANEYVCYHVPTGDGNIYNS